MPDSGRRTSECALSAISALSWRVFSTAVVVLGLRGGPVVADVPNLDDGNTPFTAVEPRPNPCPGPLRLHFALRQPTNVGDVVLVDVRGRISAVDPIRRTFSAGEHDLILQVGTAVPNGMYFIAITEAANPEAQVGGELGGSRSTHDEGRLLAAARLVVLR